jgi:hypothetical protein
MVAAGAVSALLMGCTASVPRPEPPPPSRSAEAPVAYARDTIVGTVAGATVVARPGTYFGWCQPMRAAERLAGFMAGFAEAPDQALALVGTGFRWYSMASDFVGGALVGLSEAQLRAAAAPAITELSRQP